MPRNLIALVITILAAGTAAATGPAAAQGLTETPRLRGHDARSVPPAVLGSLADAKGFDLGELPRQADKACVTMTMSCDSAVTGVLDPTDCDLDDGTKIDFWEFQGTTGQTVTIDMTSSEFDTFLLLINPALAVAAFDDDGGDGTNSRIVFTLDASGTWTIGANGFGPSDLGNYNLMLECTGIEPPPPAVPEIPTLGTAGLVALVLLLTGMGFWALRRRSVS